MADEVITYMNYTVYLTLEADYQQALVLGGGTPLINMCPRNLASVFGIPYPYPTPDMNQTVKTVQFYFPFTPGATVNITGSESVVITDDVDYFISVAQPGNPPSVWPAGKNTKLIWTANVLLANGGQSQPTPSNAIPQRRWIDGFEWGPFGQGGSGQLWNSHTRDASRVIDGKGFAIRGSTNQVSHNVNEYRTLTSSTSWERFYFRLRQKPAALTHLFWQCVGNIGAGTGFALRINPAGDVIGTSVIFVYQDKGTVFTPVLDEWYLIDVLIKFERNTGAGEHGEIRVYVNHTLAFSYTDVASGGLNFNSAHVSSAVGNSGDPDSECEIDIDDWVCADLPGNCEAVNLSFIDANYPVDWFVGSHIMKHYTTAITAQGAWVGNKGVLNQGDNAFGAQNNALTSSTSGDRFEASVDALTIGDQPTMAAIMGPVAAVIGHLGTNGGETDGKIGYNAAAAGWVEATIDQTSAGQWGKIGFLPSGRVIPENFAPFKICHVKSADVALDTTYAMTTSIEYIGIWAEEDDPTCVVPYNRLSNLHNCRYENTGWGYFGSVPFAPCYQVGGTYAGNSGYQEIELPAPCHMLWIRATAGAGEIVMMIVTDIAAGFGDHDRQIPNLRLWTDNFGVTKFSVSGSNVNINQTGKTYQYIAWCDPGMRYSLATEIRHALASTTPHTNYLIDPDFTPEMAWFRKENDGTGATITMVYKGQGNAGNTGSPISGGSLANVGAFGLGAFTSLADLQSQSMPYSCLLFRTAQPGCAGVMVQACTYTGNGNPTQTVPITPASGRYPLLVVVIPTNAATGYMKDPSHVGTASSALAGAASVATAIESVGIDSITVGNTLNTNAVVYQVFIIPGSDVAFANGIYFNPSCDPPVTYHEEVTLGDINVVGEGGLQVGGDYVAGAAIVAVEDLSGIYTIVAGQRHDILVDRLPGQPTILKKIPNPFFKTGFFGG